MSAPLLKLEWQIPHVYILPDGSYVRIPVRALCNEFLKRWGRFSRLVKRSRAMGFTVLDGEYYLQRKPARYWRRLDREERQLMKAWDAVADFCERHGLNLWTSYQSPLDGLTVPEPHFGAFAAEIVKHLGRKAAA